MTCAYCATVFDPVAARRSCSACVLSEGCARLRCPRCGYETPEEPKWIGAIRAWRRRRHEKRSR